MSIVDEAEAAAVQYARYLLEIPSPTVPRAWVADLVSHLSKMIAEYDRIVEEQESYREDPVLTVDEERDWGQGELDDIEF